MSAVIPIFEPSQELFRLQLSAVLEAMGMTTDGLTSIKLTPITTAEKEALTDAAGLVVYDSDLDKLCVNTGAGWQTVTST